MRLGMLYNLYAYKLKGATYKPQRDTPIHASTLRLSYNHSQRVLCKWLKLLVYITGCPGKSYFISISTHLVEYEALYFLNAKEGHFPW